MSLEGRLCEPILALAPPHVGPCRPYDSLCSCYEAPTLGLCMLALGWVELCCHSGLSTLYWPHLPLVLAYVGLCWTYGSLCAPILALSPPYVGPCRPYDRQSWCYEAPLDWPQLPLTLAYVGPMYWPHLPLMLAYVGPMVTDVSLFWP